MNIRVPATIKSCRKILELISCEVACCLNFFSLTWIKIKRNASKVNVLRPGYMQEDAASCIYK